MSTRPVRVRIGPSPTGEPHVGTGYIALFNLALAKQQGGQFILRIEDTDQTRSKREWEEQIIAGLKWLGLNWDEGPDIGGPHGPYRQSERREIYAAHIEQLIEAGHAYRCFTTPEELEQLRQEQKARGETMRYDGRHRDLPEETVKAWMAEGRPFVVRMKAPLEGEIVVKDELRGEVRFKAQQVDDQVLMKSDGLPTYHLANVVDDHLMGITHVMRAEEWISSTPKHVLLYQMFGWEAPAFIHMPLLRNKDKSKISKRKNPVSILDYKERGFLPEAVVNYLGMMGWTMPDGRELFSLQDFIDNFDLSRISLGGPVFDLEKLTWLNGKYLREVKSPQEIASDLAQLFTAERLAALVPMFRERIDTYEQFIPAAEYFFAGELTLDVALLKPKKHTLKETKELLETYVEQIEGLIDFSPESLEAVSRTFAESHEWKTRDFFMPLRVALTGRKASPGLFEVMSALGRAKSRRRLRAAVEVLSQAAKEEARAAQRAAKAAKKAARAAARDGGGAS